MDLPRDDTAVPGRLNRKERGERARNTDVFHLRIQTRIKTKAIFSSLLTKPESLHIEIGFRRREKKINQA